jgi:uncharacterized damage-inducible protein DinB
MASRKRIVRDRSYGLSMDEPKRVEPPKAQPDEVEMLLYALDRTRRTFEWKCGDLDEDGLRRTLPPSTITLAGLLKHLALVEDHYTSVALVGQPLGAPWNGVEAAEWPDWEWRSANDDAAQDLYALWREAVGRSQRAVAQMLETGGLSQLTKLTENDETLNLRRVLVDLHEEYARHLGHADLLRESIDGRVGEDAPRN